MTQTQTPNPKAMLVDLYLGEAKKMLDQQNLGEAGERLTAAIGVEGEHPGRTHDIRQMLYDYSNQAATKSPPDWGAVRETFALVGDLKLQDTEMRIHQRGLNLSEARYRLENHDDFDGSFSIFEALLNDAQHGSPDQLQGRIAQHISEYVSIRAQEHKWPQIDQVFERVKGLWSSSDDIQTWLEAILQLVNAANQISDKHQVEVSRLEQTISTQKQQNNKLTSELGIITQDRDSLQQKLDTVLISQEAHQAKMERAQRQVRFLNFALLGLLVFAAVAYLVAYILINLEIGV